MSNSKSENKTLLKKKRNEFNNKIAEMNKSNASITPETARSALYQQFIERNQQYEDLKKVTPNTPNIYPSLSEAPIGEYPAVNKHKKGKFLNKLQIIPEKKGVSEFDGLPDSQYLTIRKESRKRKSRRDSHDPRMRINEKNLGVNPENSSKRKRYFAQERSSISGIPLPTLSSDNFFKPEKKKKWHSAPDLSFFETIDLSDNADQVMVMVEEKPVDYKTFAALLFTEFQKDTQLIANIEATWNSGIVQDEYALMNRVLTYASTRLCSIPYRSMNTYMHTSSVVKDLVKKSSDLNTDTSELSLLKAKAINFVLDECCRLNSLDEVSDYLEDVLNDVSYAARSKTNSWNRSFYQDLLNRPQGWFGELVKWLFNINLDTGTTRLFRNLKDEVDAAKGLQMIVSDVQPSTMSGL